MAEQTDIYRAYNFKLDIKDTTAGHFSEISGLGVKIQAIDFREGAGAPAVRKIPGRVEYDDVTLRYGLTENKSLMDWVLKVAEGQIERKNVSIILVDTDGRTELTRWNLNNAWPTQWRGAKLEAIEQEVAIETLTLVFESLERA